VTRTGIKKLPAVAVTSPLPGNPLAMFEGKAEVRVFRATGKRSEAQVIRCLRDAQGAVTLLSDPITEKVLQACPDLRVVSNVAVGVDNVDLAACAHRGIVVTNTPDVLTESCADLTWTLLLGAARRVVEGDRFVRQGRFKGWRLDLLLGTDFRGKTLGIVGMGRIGRAVARRAVPFGFRIVYHQRHRLPASAEAALDARFVSLEELIGTADVVSLHCPLTAQTHHLLNRERLFQMKPGALLVNTGRGPLVDEAALVECLREGPLAAAGLDVYEREPELSPGLRDLPNALLLPHLGSASKETREEMARLAVTDCLAVLEGRAPAHPVPLPG
jgi:glyoxylate reductase